MTQPPRACGIDFGTSNSTVGWLRPGAPALLALEDDAPTLPSAVFFNADDDSTSYGRAALADYLDGWWRVVNWETVSDRFAITTKAR